MTCKDCKCTPTPISERQALYRSITESLKKIPPGDHEPMPAFLKARYGLNDLRLFSLSDVRDFDQYLRLVVNLKRFKPDSK